MKIKQFKNSCVQWLDNYRDNARNKFPVVQNINLNLLKEQKRILLCYLDYESASIRVSGNVFHSNIQEFFQIIQVLMRLDFVIDICANDAARAWPVIQQQSYDFIMGFGNVFREACRNNPRACSILYITENPYEIALAKEQERIAYFCQRHSVDKREITTHLRSGIFYQKGDTLSADVIITLGDETVYNSNTNIYKLYPTALLNTTYQHNNLQKNACKFLVFGAGGIICKGIDLLIEIFQKHADWTLYICGGQVTDELHKLGYKVPANVIDCGFVNVNSEKFCQLASECTWSVLPSCSEGTSTSTITCMYHGLIPIISTECGLTDFSDGCILLKNCTLETIERTLESAIRLPQDTKDELIRQGTKIVNEYFMLDIFTQNFRKIMQEIIENVNI